MLGDSGIPQEDGRTVVPTMKEISSPLHIARLQFIARAAELYDGQVTVTSESSIDLYRIQSYKQGSEDPVKVKYLPVVEYTTSVNMPPIKCVCGPDGSLYPIGPNEAKHGRYFKDNVADESLPDKKGTSRPFPIINVVAHRQFYKGKDIPLATGLPSEDGSAVVHLIQLHPASLAHGYFDLEKVTQGLKDTLTETK